MAEGGYLSLLGTLMGLIAILDRLVPRHVWVFLERKMTKLLAWTNRQTEVKIDEFEGHYSNEIYDLVDIHIASLTTSNSRLHSARRLKLSQLKNASKPRYNPDSGQVIEEEFRGAIFKLEHDVILPDKSSGGGGYYFDRSMGIRRSFIVTTHQRHKYTLLPPYLDYVIDHGKKLRRQNSDRKLFTNIRSEGWEYRRKPWRSVPFKHASTFGSIALPEKLKEMIISDLDAFMAGEEFFRKVGRAWKRGYLLHGPPGTGKSSLIAAIANYTQFDVYDLELTEVKSNAQLRELLMGVSNKSIIVIEDIDCSLELKNRGKPAPDAEDDDSDEKEKKSKTKKEEDDDQGKSRVTLSGLLNFIDGLWSCIGDERIIIFTTNHKEKLDPALLRAGRMDLHILLSHCSFEAFKVLAWTHIGVREHPLFVGIDALMSGGGAKMTPADVAEILIQNREDAGAALEKLVNALEESAKSSESNPAAETGETGDGGASLTGETGESSLGISASKETLSPGFS